MFGEVQKLEEESDQYPPGRYEENQRSLSQDNVSPNWDYNHVLPETKSHDLSWFIWQFWGEVMQLLLTVSFVLFLTSTMCAFYGLRNMHISNITLKTSFYGFY